MKCNRHLAGKAQKVISPSMTWQMLTPQKDEFGLGFALSGSGKARTFGHNGRDEGFDARLLAFAETGQGVVIMINANENSGAMGRIADAVARTYQWPERTPPPARK